MPLPRFIPKPVFQKIGLLLLATCLTVITYWITNDTGLYRAFQNVSGSKELAMLVTSLVMIIGLFVIIIPLRMCSTMSTVKEELGVGLQDGLPAVLEGIKRVSAKEAIKHRELSQAQEYTHEMKQRVRQHGLIFIVIGVLLTAAGILMLAVLGEIWMMLIVGPIAIGAGVIQIVTGKPVFRNWKMTSKPVFRM